MAMEIWVTTRLTARLTLLPPAVAPLAESAVIRLIELVLQLATAVAVVSSTSSALVAIEGLGPSPEIIAEREKQSPAERLREWIERKKASFPDSNV